MLAVATTSTIHTTEIVYDNDEEENVLIDLNRLFTTKLRFESISLSRDQPPREEIAESFILTQHFLNAAAATTNDSTDLTLFHCLRDGYWNGTVIRMSDIIHDENRRSHLRLKIYNK